MRKSWHVFHDRSLLWRCFYGFVLPVLEYCSAVWCSAAETLLKLMDCVVCRWCPFLTGSVFECNIAHRRSVAVLFMMYKIKCNPMHSLYRSLPVPYVPVRVTRGSLIAHRYTPPLSVSLWNDLAYPVFDGVGLVGFKCRANAFLLAYSCLLHFGLLLFSLALISFYRLVFWD